MLAPVVISQPRPEEPLTSLLTIFKVCGICLIVSDRPCKSLFRHSVNLVNKDDDEKYSIMKLFSVTKTRC